MYKCKTTLTFTVAMVTQNCRKNRLNIGNLQYSSKIERFYREINIEHKQIPKGILTEDEINQLEGKQHITRIFRYFAVLTSNS